MTTSHLPALPSVSCARQGGDGEHIVPGTALGGQPAEQPHMGGTGRATGFWRRAEPWNRVRHRRAQPQPQEYVGAYR